MWGIGSWDGFAEGSVRFHCSVSGDVAEMLILHERWQLDWGLHVWSGHVCLPAWVGKGWMPCMCVFGYIMRRSSFISGVHWGTFSCLLQLLCACGVISLWKHAVLGLCLSHVCKEEWRMSNKWIVHTDSEWAKKPEGVNKIYSPAIEQVVETKNMKFRASLTSTQSIHKEQTVLTCAA